LQQVTTLVKPVKGQKKEPGDVLRSLMIGIDDRLQRTGMLY
jgi:hypothetical protein